MKSRYEERLLEALLDKGLISLERAQETMLEHRASGRPAAEILVDSGAVTEDVLIAFLARAAKTAPIDVTKFPLRQDLASLLAPEQLREYRVLPMERIGSSLTVAMVNPFDDRAVKAVAKTTGLRVKVVVTGPGMLEKRLSELTPPLEPHPRRRPVADETAAESADRAASPQAPSAPIKARVVRASSAPAASRPTTSRHTPPVPPGPVTPPGAARSQPPAREPKEEEEIFLSPAPEIERKPIPEGPAEAVPENIPPEPDEILASVTERFFAPRAEALPEYVASLFKRSSGGGRASK